MTQVHVPETRDDMARVLYERWFGVGTWDADSKMSPQMRDCQLREADFVLTLIAAGREQQRTAAIAPVIMHPGDAWPPKVWTVAMCPGWRGLQWTLLHPTAICDKLFWTYEDAAREAARLDAASESGTNAAAVQRNGTVLRTSDDCSVLGGW